MKSVVDIAEHDAGIQDNPTLEYVGTGTRFVCPHCFFQGMSGTPLLPSGQAIPPVVNVELFNTTVICRGLFTQNIQGAAQSGGNILMTIGILSCIVAMAGTAAFLAFFLALRFRKWLQSRHGRKTAILEGGLVMGVPVPQALGECIKDVPSKEDWPVAQWCTYLHRDVVVVPLDAPACSPASLPVPHAHHSHV
jgi:hypothetical protein